MNRILLITGVFAALILLILPAPATETAENLEPRREHLIQPERLAEWILSGDQGYLLLDVRSDEAFSRNGIKTAVPVESLDEATIRALPGHRRVVVYAASTAGAVEAWNRIRQYREDVYVLDGGVAVWDGRVLHPDTPAENASEQAWGDYHKNIAVAHYLLGKTLDIAPVERERTVQPLLRPRAPLPKDEGC